jgi:hypothetical protein
MSRFLPLPLLGLAILGLVLGEGSLTGQGILKKKLQVPGPNPGGGPTTEVTIPLAPEDVLKVRIPDLSDQGFDEKGNIKTLTAAEKEKAKGDTPAEKKLPGYKGTMANLKPGDIVAVTLSNARTDPKDKEKKVYSASNKPPIQGRLMSVGKDSITVQVPGVYQTTPTVKAKTPTDKNKDKGDKGAGNKATVPDSTPATMIVIVQAAQSGPEPKRKK